MENQEGCEKVVRVLAYVVSPHKQDAKGEGQAHPVLF
jgi:hypothetical protein